MSEGELGAGSTGYPQHFQDLPIRLKRKIGRQTLKRKVFGVRCFITRCKAASDHGPREVDSYRMTAYFGKLE